MAHNLARAVGHLVGGDLAKASTTTLQRGIFTVPGRLVHSGHLRHLRLTASWPWAEAIEHALTNIAVVRCAAEQRPRPNDQDPRRSRQTGGTPTP